MAIGRFKGAKDSDIVVDALGDALFVCQGLRGTDMEIVKSFDG